MSTHMAQLVAMAMILKVFIIISSLYIYDKAAGFLFLQDLKDPKENEYDATLGEDFYYANGHYNYHVRCAFDAPGNEEFDQVGLFIYRKLAPLKGCIKCLHDPSGTDGKQRDELCVGYDIPECERLGIWPEARIPNYENHDGKKFYADFIFASSDEFTWGKLATLFISCYAYQDKSTDVHVQSSSILANPTLWGLGWDYSDWTHWIIAIVIILAAIQFFGMIGYLMKKSKNKNMQVLSKIIICQHCFISQLAKLIKKKAKRKKPKTSRRK